VNPEELKYMLMPQSQKIGQKHSLQTVNTSSEDVAKFKYLGTTQTDQNCMHEQVKFRERLLSFGSESYVLLSAV
jgi:hypothetical protein